MGSSPGRLFSTHSPPTCRPGGLKLCTSASEPTTPNADDLSRTFPYLPPTASIIQLCPTYAYTRPRSPIFAATGSKFLFWASRGFFFLQCFRVAAALSDLFTGWFNAVALGARGQLGWWGGPESLDKLEILRSSLIWDYQTWESAANKHWVKTSKTTGAQSLHWAPLTEQ